MSEASAEIEDDHEGSFHISLLGETCTYSRPLLVKVHELGGNFLQSTVFDHHPLYQIYCTNKINLFVLWTNLHQLY